MFEFKDNENRLTIRLTENSGYSQLEEYAQLIQKLYNAPVVKDLDDLYQHYWHFDLQFCTLKLYMEDCAGIFIYIEDGTHNDFLRDVANQILSSK